MALRQTSRKWPRAIHTLQNTKTINPPISWEVTAATGDLKQQRMVRTGSSYLSHSAPVLTFGLGAVEKVESLEIRWPDGTRETLETLEAGSAYWIEQGKGIVKRRAFKKPS